MSLSTTRRFSEAARDKARREAVRRWVALGLLVFSTAVAAWLLTRDIDWESRRREARERGLTAEENGDYAGARLQYENALASQPYDWATHLSLANLLYHRLNEHERALGHYLQAKAYMPSERPDTDIAEKMASLLLIRRGSLENPADALDDMFMAIEGGAKMIFRARLADDLDRNLDAYWDGWMERGRGRLVYQTITTADNVHFEAQVEVEYPNAAIMSMHLACTKNVPWRLVLSFP